MSLFDGLDDYESARCADCRAHRGAAECRKCEFEQSTDQYHPPIVGQADMSYMPKLEAERITAEWRNKSARHPSDLSEGELFGGKRQKEMF